MTPYRSSESSRSVRSLFSIRLSGPQRTFHRGLMIARIVAATAAIASTFLTWERWPDRGHTKPAIDPEPLGESFPRSWWELGLDLRMTLMLVTLSMIGIASIWALRTRRLAPTVIATVLSAIFSANGLRDAIITFAGTYPMYVGQVTFYAAVIVLGVIAALELALVVPMFRWVRARLPMIEQRLAEPAGTIATQ